MPRPMVVETAAPVTPNFGNGPSPKIRQGSRQMLMMLATQSTRMATPASPAPRNTPLIRNSIRMVPEELIIIRLYKEPTRRISGPALISANSLGARGKQNEKIRTAIAKPRKIACTAACAAPSLSCSPVRRATTAVAPILKPTANAITITSMPSVMPTVAVASAPRRATKNMSTMPKSDSMAISRTMGTARRMIARSIEMAVKSCRDPAMASLIKANKFEILDGEGFCTIELKHLSIKALPSQDMRVGRNNASRICTTGLDAGEEQERVGYRMFIGVKLFCTTDECGNAKLKEA